VPAAQAPNAPVRQDVAERAAKLARFVAGIDDAVVITRAGSTGVSLHEPSKQLDALSKHWRTWHDTAAANGHFASGERMRRRTAALGTAGGRSMQLKSPGAASPRSRGSG